jgi:hypothetical protein
MPLLFADLATCGCGDVKTCRRMMPLSPHLSYLAAPNFPELPELDVGKESTSVPPASGEVTRDFAILDVTQASRLLDSIKPKIAPVFRQMTILPEKKCPEAVTGFVFKNEAVFAEFFLKQLRGAGFDSVVIHQVAHIEFDANGTPLIRGETHSQRWKLDCLDARIKLLSRTNDPAAVSTRYGYAYDIGNYWWLVYCFKKNPPAAAVAAPSFQTAVSVSGLLHPFPPKFYYRNDLSEKTAAAALAEANQVYAKEVMQYTQRAVTFTADPTDPSCTLIRFQATEKLFLQRLQSWGHRFKYVLVMSAGSFTSWETEQFVTANTRVEHSHKPLVLKNDTLFFLYNLPVATMVAVSPSSMGTAVLGEIRSPEVRGAGRTVVSEEDYNPFSSAMTSAGLLPPADSAAAAAVRRPGNMVARGDHPFLPDAVRSSSSTTLVAGTQLPLPVARSSGASVSAASLSLASRATVGPAARGPGSTVGIGHNPPVLPPARGPGGRGDNLFFMEPELEGAGEHRLYCEYCGLYINGTTLSHNTLRNHMI